MRHIGFGAAALFGTIGVGIIGAAAAPARAGAVLMTRESTLRISGSTGSGDYNKSDGTLGLGAYELAIRPDLGSAGSADSEAGQTSKPSVNGGALLGAFAEGSARARIGGIADGSFAESDFQMTFEVVDAPVVFHFTGTIGVASDALVVARMTSPRAIEPVFAHELDGSVIDDLAAADQFAGDARRELNTSGVLEPGAYWVAVSAVADGNAVESQGFYSVNLSVEPLRGATAGPSAIPLPPAMWTGLSALIALGGARFWTRLKRVR